MLLEISGEITPERKKGWSQSENNTQLWMELVLEARFDDAKSNIVYRTDFWTCRRRQGWDDLRE